MSWEEEPDSEAVADLQTWVRVPRHKKRMPHKRVGVKDDLRLPNCTPKKYPVWHTSSDFAELAHHVISDQSYIIVQNTKAYGANLLLESL